MEKNRILFWESSVSDMKHGRKFGGIAVQINFWMQIFASNGWDVHALTEDADYNDDVATYHNIRHFQSAEIAWEWILIYRIIKSVRPQLIIFRGARRLLYPLCIIGHSFGAKVIMQAASDVNFVPGKADVGNAFNRRMYECALNRIDYIVCQNEYQTNTLKTNYERKALIIPNIWGNTVGTAKSKTSSPEVVWVANFRKLKRPEWFLGLAQANPNIKFSMAGGPISKEFFNHIAHEAATIPNLSFLGPISIEESNTLIGNAKILVCTSEYEGFPNTFLQAWSAGVPVVSTVDPNNIINTFNLGQTVDDQESLDLAIKALLSDNDLYISMQQSIGNYFSAHHSAQKCFDKLIDYIHEI